MVVSCSAFGCTNRQVTRSTPGFSDTLKKKKFHRFPLKDPVLLQRWLLAIRRKDFIPTEHSRICGDHFTENDYKPAKRVLKTCAVPSIFIYSANAKKQRARTRHSIVNKVHKLNNYVEDNGVLKVVAIPNIFNYSDSWQNLKKEKNITIYPLIDKIQKLSTDKYVVVHVANPTSKEDSSCAEKSAKSTRTAEINGVTLKQQTPTAHCATNIVKISCSSSKQ